MELLKNIFEKDDKEFIDHLKHMQKIENVK